MIATDKIHRMANEMGLVIIIENNEILALNSPKYKIVTFKKGNIGLSELSSQSSIFNAGSV